MIPASPVSPRTVLRTVFALTLLTTLIVAVQMHHRTAEKLKDPAGGHVSDFDRWMLMTPRFVHDRVDYVDDLLPTPPITLMVFAPLAELSRPNAQFVWVCAKLGFAAAVFALAMQMVSAAGVTLTAQALLLMVSGWWLPVVVDMQEGQTNFLALLPLMAGLRVTQRGTAWSETAGGALIGIGVAVKLTPLAFVGYFAWRRRWRLVAASAVSTALCWLVVPALAFGWSQNLAWFTQWARIMIVPYVARGEVVYATSQSIGSFALRLLSAMPAFESNHAGVITPHYTNLLALDRDVVGWMVRVAMIAVALAGIWWMRRPLRSLQSRRYIVELGAVAAFMLWFSERTWVHHYVSFVLMLAAAGMVLSDPAETATVRRRVTIAAGALFIAQVLSSEAGKMFGPDGVDWVKASGIFLIASMLLTAAVLQSRAATDQ